MAPRSPRTLYCRNVQGCEVHAAFALVVKRGILLGGIRFALLNVFPLNFNDTRKRGTKAQHTPCKQNTTEQGLCAQRPPNTEMWHLVDGRKPEPATTMGQDQGGLL